VSPVRAEKSELRQRMRDARDALSAEQVARASDGAAANVLRLDGVRDARLVALYAPIPGAHELETSAIHEGVAARGGRLVYPVVRGRDAPLDFHLVDDVEDLRPSRLGIPQPDPATPVVPLDTIDVFVIPGLAFDLEGERLGWGRGHYDRTLARAPEALRVGYAFELQIVDRVPVGADDQRMDVLVTETGARKAPPRRSR
jgi:5-formyltetrahydrofolate cyclo-ligase